MGSHQSILFATFDACDNQSRRLQKAVSLIKQKLADDDNVESISLMYNGFRSEFDGLPVLKLKVRRQITQGHAYMEKSFRFCHYAIITTDKYRKTMLNDYSGPSGFSWSGNHRTALVDSFNEAFGTGVIIVPAVKEEEEDTLVKVL